MQIFYDEYNSVRIIKIKGRATMKISQDVERLLMDNIKTPIIDFSEVEYLDSTFLGLIAKYTMIYKQKNNEFLTILKPDEKVLQLLRQTGILNFVVIIDKTILINAKPIEISELDSNISDHILELHEILMNLNEDNKKVFGPVVEQMKKGMKK